MQLPNGWHQASNEAPKKICGALDLETIVSNINKQYNIYERYLIFNLAFFIRSHGKEHIGDLCRKYPDQHLTSQMFYAAELLEDLATLNNFLNGIVRLIKPMMKAHSPHFI